MGNELEKKVDAKQQALIDTVRQTIFPDATDPELALFFHKCNVVGVNPLDQLIHPTKYKQPDGSYRVTFITSINLLRSKSEETQLYDGMDEPEYEGDSTHTAPEMENGQPVNYTAPDLARVKVYKKGISRPFVGIARWKEYYPGDKKGFQWRKMPYHMLAKCAEALARRLAFPDKLNQLYTEEEMMQATEQLAGVSGPKSTKPNVTPDQVRPRSEAPAGGQGMPVGNVDKVEVIGGTNPKTKKPWKKWGVTIGGTAYGTFDEKVGAHAEMLKGMTVEFTFTDDGKYKTLSSIKKAAPPPSAAQEPAQHAQAPEVEDSESFASTLILIAKGKGIEGDAAINAILGAEFSFTLDTVPADMQKQVLEHFNSL